MLNFILKNLTINNLSSYLKLGHSFDLFGNEKIIID